MKINKEKIALITEELDGLAANVDLVIALATAFETNEPGQMVEIYIGLHGSIAGEGRIRTVCEDWSPR
jgi:hypothetical protein